MGRFNVDMKNLKGFPGGPADKESAYNAEDLSSIPGLGGSPGDGNGYSLQYWLFILCSFLFKDTLKQYLFKLYLIKYTFALV